nr:nicalin-1-like isoform X2 [Tanacetum cinerariifolium]
SCVVELCDASTVELADHVVEVNLQHDVLDGMFTFYDSTVSTLQIFQVDLLLLLGLGSYLITLFSLLVINTRGLDDLIIRCKCANKPGIRMYF